MMPSSTYESHARCFNTEVAREYAAMGSDRLCRAMRRQYVRAALRHGITVSDASLLLQNGVAI